MSETIRDPVCGMNVPLGEALSLSRNERSFYFCSQLCMRRFVADPGAYGGAAAVSAEIETVARRIAYFSMEVAVDARLPTYSGGLGVLAADALRSFADLRIPAVGVSLLYWGGYFDQKLDEWGNQTEAAVEWDPSTAVRPLSVKARVQLEGRPVAVRAWQYDVKGASGFTVPLILLDTRLAENSLEDRKITSFLYGGDQRYRILQEVVLGVGGIRVLRALGYSALERFHLNEGHAAFLGLELLRNGGAPEGQWDFRKVRERCVFTTHTPVAAGHDQFPWQLAEGVLGEEFPSDILRMLGGPNHLNMTLLAMNLSQYVNGVARKHGEVSQAMFPLHAIDSITNGVHSRFWTCGSFARLFDKYIPGWCADPFSLRNAVSIPKDEIWSAHVGAKSHLIEEVYKRNGVRLSADALTIGFARRATPYKRPDLLFADLERLRQVGRGRPMQIVYAGKAHPRDEGGKDLIRRVFNFARALGEDLRVAYLANYDLELAGILTSGVDLWLNTPRLPLEASGTSGMKAAHNGVPSFSTRDGWWIEGHIEGVTGWSIGSAESDDGRDAAELYQKLDAIIAPLFFGDRIRWIDIMRNCIALNASFFNSHRMVQQYAASAYL